MRLIHFNVTWKNSVIFMLLLTSIKLFIPFQVEGTLAENEKLDLPIFINGNKDFLEQAASRGWDLNGRLDGSKSAPFIIEGLNIEGNFNPNLDLIESGILINIRNTNLYFIIRNCRLTGGSNGIQFKNVINGAISSNIITFNFNSGITFNTGSNLNRIENNYILHNIRHGISVNSIISNENSIINNIIKSNDRDGIHFTRNVAITPELTANIIENNIIMDNSNNGIYLQFGINFNLISNLFINNSEYGLKLSGETSLNMIKNNSFINNNHFGLFQALDNGINNNFSYNYWDDWSDPDHNQDGLINDPYQIDGNTNNQDFFPLIQIPINIVPNGKDGDGDGIFDVWETFYNLDPSQDDANEDPDGDGISNYWEFEYGLNPNKDDDQKFLEQLGNSDKDKDGMSDLYEILHELNPRINDALEDKDGDLISNYVEYREGSAPNSFWSVPIYYFISAPHFLVAIIFMLFLLGVIAGFSLNWRKKKKLIEQLGAPDYNIAKKMIDGGFYDYVTFKKAQQLHTKSVVDYEFLVKLKKQ